MQWTALLLDASDNVYGRTARRLEGLTDEVVELLLARGADVAAEHRLAVVWGGEGRSGDRVLPIDWAEHFGRTDVVELLRGT